MLSTSFNKFGFLFANYPQISSKVLEYLSADECLELSLICKTFNSSVNALVTNNITEFQAIWAAAKDSESSSGDSSEEEVKKDTEALAKKKNKAKKNNAEKVSNHKWQKKNIFELAEHLKTDLTNFKHFNPATDLQRLDTDIQEKFLKGTQNSFFINEATNQLIVINRSLVDQGLNFEFNDDTQDGEHKYADLYSSENFSQTNFDFSNPKALLERQKMILESLSKGEAEKEAKKLNIIPKPESLLKLKKITVLLCQGGYFSLGIFDKKKSLFHKSDHKYVVRKKAGKRQITRDSNSGSNIQSMGSQIRRDQEKKHAENIKKILTESYKQIKDSDLILYHAPGYNRYLILDVGSPLYNLKDKFRSICLTPKKANYTEVERIYEYLTKLYIMPLNSEKQ